MNLRLLGEEQVCYLCAMQPPKFNDNLGAIYYLGPVHLHLLLQPLVEVLQLGLVVDLVPEQKNIDMRNFCRGVNLSDTGFDENFGAAVTSVPTTKREEMPR